MELFGEASGQKGPPTATIARRAKSYSDFYDAAIGYLGKEAKQDNAVDLFGISKDLESGSLFQIGYEEYEGDFLDASHAEYQYVFLALLKPREF